MAASQQSLVVRQTKRFIYLRHSASGDERFSAAYTFSVIGTGDGNRDAIGLSVEPKILTGPQRIVYLSHPRSTGRCLRPVLRWDALRSLAPVPPQSGPPPVASELAIVGLHIPNLGQPHPGRLVVGWVSRERRPQTINVAVEHAERGGNQHCIVN